MTLSVTLSPAALFQIIKDIKMGPSSDFSTGRLYGMPSDGNGAPIEVTHTFPNFSRLYPKRPTEEQDIKNYDADVEKFTIDHLNNVQKLNYDLENVGWYSSRNCGRRFDFNDLPAQYFAQKRDSSYFCLVVDMSCSTLSLRAFRIKDEAMNYLSKHPFGIDEEIPNIDNSMLFDNLLQELNVSFKLTKLEETIVNQILSSFSLVTDVFHLRDHSSFESHIPDIADKIANINDELNYSIKDAEKVRENHAQRNAFIKERRETNEKRAARGLPPLPEEEVDYAVPLIVPCNKVKSISDIYTFNSKSAALRAEMEEETTKISVLTALGNANQ
ncbi:Eukaryotic translation initiation factor 3 subunit H [Histomonas meleagridis]|uniref:Eukaryotic translation initiation factor 3 subunit H n=1 Tax=Histomonas meleagridis TaxID=135588 RepID=UPI00355A16E4|nr:Eukaryotic translation initiation factor 3 subunit H [Histomonas meleagridis]KAH0803438.1 Eukaryotic translation initiation factor 3 subunit H [Histomonas meleagridis]